MAADFAARAASDNPVRYGTECRDAWVRPVCSLATPCTARIITMAATRTTAPKAAHNRTRTDALRSNVFAV